MALADDDRLDEKDAAPARRSRLVWILWSCLAIIILAAAVLAVAWFSRERIARDLIEEQLAALDLPATYEIEKVAGREQILRNIVVGDPERPDLTVERASITLTYDGFGYPELGRIELLRPRLFGTWRNGQLSFGSLDRVLFPDSDAPPGLPEIDLAIRDGRALLETDYGRIGLKAEGSGRLDDGFAGILAATAPTIEAADCDIADATAFGRIRSTGNSLTFNGPVRFAGLNCPLQALSLQDATFRTELSTDEAFDQFSVMTRIAAGRGRYEATSLNGLTGTVRADLSGGRVTSSYALAARGAQTGQIRAALLTAEGTVRASDGFAEVEANADIEANGIRPGDSLDRIIADLSAQTSGTLIDPLLRKLRGALAEAAPGSRLAASAILRQNDERTTIIVPEARLRGGSGATLLQVSSAQLRTNPNGRALFSGNFATSGPGIPSIAGRTERGENGGLVLRLAMREYAAGSSRLALPQFEIRQAADGGLRFSGRAEASGPLPGGFVRDLALPVDGTYSAAGELALWRDCTDVRFDQLRYANLTVQGRAITLCPRNGSPILRGGEGDLQIAARAPSLDVSGSLGSTPIALSSGALSFAFPGVLDIVDVNATIGPEATATLFRISGLQARLEAEGGIGGTFDDADVTIANVPLDLIGTSGDWRYAGGTLSLGDAAFVLQDRAEPDRFEPLDARNATLTLRANRIIAAADLFSPASDRLVTEVALEHDLSDGTGFANLTVPGIVFDEDLQPDQLSRLALGVVANTRGVVTGTGRLDWNGEGVRSTGAFSSEALDFAAAFGPVQGASGTVVFSDLLGLTTAPNQRISVQSVNPGIEVTGGTVSFGLRDGEVLTVEGASWPFLGGTLTLAEVDLNLGISEERRYVFDITGLNAARFVENFGLENIVARGTFDGRIPVIFNAAGNGRIEGGLLVSRPPGGTISYVGELTYEDLSPMANFAFDALRAIDYSEMRIAMDGELTGELVTRVRFDGVTQGEGTRSNFITRRIAELPLRFNINIRAPFYQLITTIRSIYDPEFVRDPRELGLLSDDGERLKAQTVNPPAAEDGPDLIPEITPDTIQPTESEKLP